MIDRALAGIACVLAGLALVGCGANTGANTKSRNVAPSTTAAAPAPSTTGATTTPAAEPTAGAPSSARSEQAHKFIPPPANAIIFMRRFSPVSLTWQSVFVEPDGRGLLTSLIGETAGAPHRAFRLPAGQLAKLRALIATAKSVKPGASRPGDYLYTLHIPGQAQFSFEGPTPKRLTALVNFLDGLTLTYCC